MFLAACPLADAVLRGDAATVSWLLLEDRSALWTPDRDGLKPIHRVQSPDVARLIVGAVPCMAHAPTSDGRTPLMTVSSCDVVTQLIEAGVCPTNVRHNVDRMTPLHVAARRGDVDMIVYLLDFWPELLRMVDSSGRTAAWYSATNGHARALEYLLRRAPDLSDGAVAGAATAGNVDVLRMVVDACTFDSLVRKDSSGRTPLHHAAASGSVASVGALVTHIKTHGRQVGVGTTDDRGDTAMHAAAAAGHFGVMTFLQTIAPSVTHVKNAHGHTPADVFMSRA